MQLHCSRFSVACVVLSPLAFLYVRLIGFIFDCLYRGSKKESFIYNWAHRVPYLSAGSCVHPSVHSSIDRVLVDQPRALVCTVRL